MIHVLTLTFLRPDAVEGALAEHRSWLRKLSDRGLVLLSGLRPGGAVIITADLGEDQARELAESDPWYRQGIASYQLLSFEGRNVSPGLVTSPVPDDSVLLINVATTSAAEETVDALALAVRHVAATAPGFRGSRLLTSVEGDAVVNLAAWSSEKEFAAIFDDPEFTRLYGEFAKTTEGAKFRLYRTSRVFSPAR